MRQAASVQFRRPEDDTEFENRPRFGIGRQVVRSAGDLQHRGDASADELAGLRDTQRIGGAECFELNLLFQPVARYVRADPVHHGNDRLFDGVVVGVAVDEAVHGVAHQDRRIGGIEDDYGFSAFGSAHRAHASTEGVAKLLDDRAAGYLLQSEVEALSSVLEDPARPLVAVLGGAKVSDKIEVIQNLLNVVEKLLIGGAMAYTFLRAKNEPGSFCGQSHRAHTAA